MDISKILDELRVERERIEQAILSLQRLSLGGGGKRRGRPPAWMKTVTAQADDAPKRRGRPPGSKNKSKDEE